MEQTVGLVGLGQMGSAIGHRLLDGVDLVVHHRREATARPFLDRGARSGPLATVAACDVVVLCLPGPQQVRELLSESSDLVSGMAPGSMIVDTTSSTPALDMELSGLLAERGIAFVDAPIAGGVRHAYEGKATFMVGASDADFERAEALLTIVTPSVLHMGPVGSGHAAKLVNNFLNMSNRLAVVDALAVAREYGIDSGRMVELLNRSSGRSYVTEYTYPTIVAEGLPQGFAVGLMAKDVGLANDLADEVGADLRFGPLVASILHEAVERLGADADLTELMTDGSNAPGA